MTITIPFPQDTDASSYSQIKAYLKQLELAVHHAQKSVESAEANKVPVTANAMVYFNHPSFDNMNALEGRPEDFATNYYEELQNVELEIVLQ